MISIDRERLTFKRSVIFSITAHLAVFLLLVLSPHLPKPSQKEMIHYVSLVSIPGGGGGGGGQPGGGGGKEEKLEETPAPKRETLRDLTTPEKLQERSASNLRHPVEKPKRESKPKPEKKAIIQKQQRTPSKSSQARKASTGPVSGKGAGSGSGVRIGSGSGVGSGYASKIAVSNFPYTYYLQIMVDRISSNWFQSLVDPGIRGNFQVTVYFRIHKDGQISALKVEETSRIRSLDLSALRAIQSSAPFPPLPREYEEEYLGIHLIFEHSK